MNDETEELNEVDGPDHRTPEYWMGEFEVEDTEFDYTQRHPDDWIISGPIGRGSPGRVFPHWEAAEKWAREFYGDRFRGPVLEALDGGCRWAFWVRGPRGAQCSRQSQS